MFGYRIVPNASSTVKLILQMGTFGNILKISWLIWKIPLVSTSYFSLVPKGVFFWVVNRKEGALQHLDRVDLWNEKEIRSRSWWHDTGFAIVVTPNKTFFTKKKFLALGWVKWCFAGFSFRKLQIWWNFLWMRKLWGEKKKEKRVNETPVFFSSKLWEIHMQILPGSSPQRWASASNILEKSP